MPTNAPEREDLRHLIDPICASCNDAGCRHCDESINDIPPEMRDDMFDAAGGDLYRD